MSERNAYLVSGDGSTFFAMARAVQAGRVVGVENAVLIATNPNARAIDLAKHLDYPIPIETVDPRTYRMSNGKTDPDGYAQGLKNAVVKHGATMFTQNGLLPITPEEFVLFMNTIGPGGVNQHPGRNPDFGGKGMYGRRVHAATLMFRRATNANGDNSNMWTEPVVHRVTSGVDEGPVIRSQRVPILPSDTVEDLKNRVLPVEHALNIQVLKDFGAGNVIERPLFSIVQPGQEVILQQSKQYAILLYPRG